MVHILKDWRIYAVWTLAAFIVASASFSVGQAFGPVLGTLPH